MTTVALHSRRLARARLATKAQHATPALVLLVAGLRALGEGARGLALALAVVEIASSALLIGAFVRAVVSSRRSADPHGPAHRGVDWIDIFTSAVLFAEAAERYHLTHRLHRPTILLAVVMLTIGLLHGRIARAGARRLTLRVEDTGLYVGGKPFRSMRANWDEVAAIEIGPRFGVIRLTDGRERRIDLHDLQGPDAVRAVLEQARERVALPPSDPAAVRG